MSKTIIIGFVAAILNATTSFSLGSTIATIVAEDFGGFASDPLNGTTADTFSPAISAAGGSSTWAASSTINADGSITPFSSFDGIGYLDVGSYIEDAKGTENGMFELEVTLGESTTGNWVGLGFTNQIPASLGDMFGIPPIGVAFAGYNRSPAVAFFYGGPGFTNAPSTATTPITSGPHSITILLDLLTYDGVTDFGSVSYAVDGVPVVGSEHVFTEANTFQTIAIAQDNGGNGGFSSLQLRQQVPEPATATMLICVVTGLVAFRRGAGSNSWPSYR